MIVPIRPPDDVVYPDTDGKPMGENSVQVQWIVDLYNGFTDLFAARDDVVVASDLFWYPVRGQPTTVTAPDVMVVFGRPKGRRGNYRRWAEGGVPPQVTVEIQSPSNTPENLAATFEFYQRHGVEEYYLYDPDAYTLQVWTRSRRKLVAVGDADGFVSPRLGVQFVVPGDEPMRVILPGGEPLKTYVEVRAEAEAAQRRAERERRRANRVQRQAEAARAQNEAFAAKLRELGIDPDTIR